VVLFGLSVVIFVIARVVPGDPARLALGPLATKEQLERFRQSMGLDKPLYEQYYYWLKQAIRGDFGRSITTRRAVSQDIKEFFPATLELCLVAAFIEAVFGILLGVSAGRFANTWVDNFVRGLAYIGVVTPAFVFAILFLLLFGYVLQLLPTVGRLAPSITPPPTITGLIIIDGLITGNFAAAKDALIHVLLPALSLALGGLSQDARITRSSIVDNSGKDYIGLMRSCGVPERKIMFKYLLKPSLIPTVSIMGLDFAVLFSNAFLVELVFGWPGISRYGVTAMLNKDLNAMVAVVILLGVIFVLMNLLVDIVISYLDPRIRLGMGRR
jgi:peptide/nickel transport system permease protein